MSAPLSRRRFITISATALGAGLLSVPALATSSTTVRWRGVAMGARASLVLNHPDRRRAETALQIVQNEVRRLEKVFSLYDQGSSLSRLNREGILHTPPLDLVRCLDDAARISQVTDGAFDVTVQPLWSLYARHFATGPAGSGGPDLADIKAARRLVDYKAVDVETYRIRLNKPGMAITLNGIAQGYITDRVTEVLQAHGFDNVLVDLGEARAIGHREGGEEWRAGIRSPRGDGGILRKVELNNQAMATSGGYGSLFSDNGQHHHLFDPKSGRSANHWSSLSVIAGNATRADALSTAFISLTEAPIRRIADNTQVSVIAYDGKTVVAF